MDVSDNNTGPRKPTLVTDLGTQTQDESGHALLDTVASLTGLPEDLVQQELHEMLAMAGQSAGNVTLEQLRQAMLLYLEALALQEEGLTDDAEAMMHAAESSIIPSA